MTSHTRIQFAQIERMCSARSNASFESCIAAAERVPCNELRLKRHVQIPMPESKHKLADAY